jgi:hypothetical protein
VSQPTKVDLAKLFELLDSGIRVVDGDYAEEDENGVVTVFDKKGTPKMQMSRKDWDDIRKGIKT